MKPICVVYHCLTHLGNPPELKAPAVDIIREQMAELKQSGLLDACSEFIVGINGGAETQEIANLIIPAKAKVVLHGLDSRSENLTMIEVEKFVKTHPNWNVFYHHAKSSTHDPNSDYGKFGTRWRRCMQKRCVTEWRQAVSFINNGHDAAGCHWLTGQGHDHSQHYFAGTFWWATSNFLATVPSMYLRDRIKQSGIGSLESRYEAEVWIGNGRLPRVKDLEPSHGFSQCP